MSEGISGSRLVPIVPMYRKITNIVWAVLECRKVPEPSKIEIQRAIEPQAIVGFDCQVKITVKLLLTTK